MPHGPLLKFELRQVRLEHLDRYYLPLPKMTSAQMRLLDGRLASEGFSTRTDGERLTGNGASGRITVAPYGLAWSSGELLDVLAPAVPDLLHFPREPATSNPYFAAKKVRGGFEIQFFPRMEGLRIWNELRREGECGLTPDEGEVVSRVLAGVDHPLECVTDYPTDGCSMLQVGRRQYYRSLVSAGEFVARLRTVSNAFSRNCYLPRSSVMRVASRTPPAFPESEELGEWCFVGLGPKSL
jgi:hypothetical protein